MRSQQRQDHWRKPAAINFFMGGTGVGLQIILTLTELGVLNFQAVLPAEIVNLIPPLLVLVGFFAVALEAGKPLRGRLVFINFGRSWMSREVVFGILFIVAVVCTNVFQLLFFRILIIPFALLYIISQGMILYRSIAIVSWNVYTTPMLIFINGLTAGFGAAMLLGSGTHFFGFSLINYGLTTLFIYTGFWMIYSFDNDTGHSGSGADSIRLRHRTPSKRSLINVATLLTTVLLYIILRFELKWTSIDNLMMLCGLLILFSTWNSISMFILNANFIDNIDIKVE